MESLFLNPVFLKFIIFQVAVIISIITLSFSKNNFICQSQSLVYSSVFAILSDLVFFRINNLTDINTCRYFLLFGIIFSALIWIFSFSMKKSFD